MFPFEITTFISIHVYIYIYTHSYTHNRVYRIFVKAGDTADMLLLREGSYGIVSWFRCIS